MGAGAQGTAAEGWEMGLQAHGAGLGSGKGDEGGLQRPGRRGRGSEAKGVVGWKAPAAEDEQRPGKEPKAEAGSGGVAEEKISWLQARAEGRGLGRNGMHRSAGARGSAGQS